MQGERKNEIQCVEFEAMLADALDGALAGEPQAAFLSHRMACSRCASVYREAEVGLRWLQALKTEQVEPPPALLGQILQATSQAESGAKQPRLPWWKRLRQLPVLAPVFQTVLQPRFAMSFAMAFFSLSAILTLTGIKLRDLRYVDLRPHTFRRGFYETEGKIVKYYENIRFVYEFESRLRDLRRATVPEESSPKPEPSKEPKNKSEGVDHNRYRNDSRDAIPPVFAGGRMMFRAPGFSGVAEWQDGRRSQ